mmetsp:Transcript_29287/g.75141  ORF Transcript_29287/g.75141 Transcript_29287/m.75141 type:complete len:566 (+) Transcript_29287:82-1779(+)
MGTYCGKDLPPGQPEVCCVRPLASDAASSAPRAAPRSAEASQALDIRGPGSSGRVGNVGRALFITHEEGTLESAYEVGEKAGEGTQGVVFKATKIKTGSTRAVKRVLKASMRGSDVQLFRKEVEIMKGMDHPNIIKLYDTYEDKQHYFLVMELCTGGELLDKIIAQGHLTEAQAAVVVQQVLRAVFHMHDNNIVHRDLKPENFLLADDGPITEDNLLKLIDFGIACECRPGQMLTELCGTPFYVAPQVVTKRYDKRCDLWSVGVIMYTLLSGTVPFTGTDQEIIKKARVGIVQYPDKVWNSVSDGAKTLVKGLLTRNVDKRLTAEVALNDKWLREMAPRAREVALPKDLVDRLNSFRNKNVVKKAALQIIAGEMNDRDVENLRKTFTALDDNSDGKLTVKEISDGIKLSGIALPADFDQILAGVDADGSGIVDYTEFLAATLDNSKHLTERALLMAFHKFDKNGDGMIRAKEICAALAGSDLGAQKKFEKAAKQVISDYGSSDELDFKQFYKMMTKSALLEDVLEEVVSPSVAASSRSSPRRRSLPDIQSEDASQDELGSNEGDA